MQETGQDISDEQLVSRICEGDKTAFAHLVERHGLRFRAIALRTCGDLAVAEEMVQEAFVKLWTKPTAFNADKARFTTWFHRVVVNRCLDEVRRKKPDALPEGFDVADDRRSADEAMAESDSGALLRLALSKMPDRQRQALTLSYLDGYSNQEAADIMDLNIKAFESLLVRARAKMREELQAEKADLLSAYA